MKFLKAHSVFIAILSVCAILRLLPLFDYQFTYDELSGMERTQFNSFSEVIEKGVKIDAHPAFVQLLIYYLVKIFGYVTWIIKLPFLLFGFGAIVYAYVFGRRHFSQQSGLLAAGIFSFSLIFVFYAPIARMYISGVFFSLGLLHHFFEIFFQKNEKRVHFFLLGLFAFLSALNQHINALFALTVCVSALFFLNRQNAKPYLVTCLLVVLAYLPHLQVTLYQLGVGGIGRENGGWLEAPEFTVVFSFLATLFGTGKTYLLICFFILLSLLLNKRKMLEKRQIYLLALFVINFLVIYGYSVWRSPVFQYSVMLFSATAFILFVCSLIQFKQSSLSYVALLLITGSLVYKSYIKKDYLNQAVKTLYEYQFERTVYYKNKLGDKNVFPVFFDADNIMKKIYFQKYQTNFACKQSSDSIISNMEQVSYSLSKDSATHTVSSLRLFSEFIAQLPCDYLVLSAAMPQHQAIVHDYFPYLIENTQTQAINFKVYSRRPEDVNKVVADDNQYYFSNPGERGKFTYSRLKDGENITGASSLSIDSLNEFPFDAKAALHEVSAREGQVVLVKAKVKVPEAYSKLELCQSVTDQLNKTPYSYNASSAADFVMGKDSVVTIYSQGFNGTWYNAAKYNSNLTAYLWNRGKEKAALTEFEIRVIEYWPRKWDWWD